MEHQADVDQIGVDFQATYVHHRLDPLKALPQIKDGPLERFNSQTIGIVNILVDLQLLGEKRLHLFQTQNLGTTDRRYISVERRMLLGDHNQRLSRCTQVTLDCEATADLMQTR
jgi:hypothetical protein